MKKSVFLFAAFVLFLAGKAQNGVSIVHQLPVEVAAGITFEADFKINKGSVNGFAKFQLDLPTGFSASSIDSKGGNYTFENQRVKIVWVAVPSDPEFEVKLEITVPKDANASFGLTPKFYFLENSVKKEAEMPTHNIRISEREDVSSTPVETTPVETTPVETTPVETNTVATTPVETTPVETNTVATTPVETTPVETNTVVTTPVETTPVETNTVATTPIETVPTNTVATTPVTNKTNAGAVYKVQLGAFSNQPDKSKFPGANVTIVEEGGYYKALSGKFNSLEEAQAHRQKLMAKGYDCFIAIYENGKRTGAIK